MFQEGVEAEDFRSKYQMLAAKYLETKKQLKKYKCQHEHTHKQLMAELEHNWRQSEEINGLKNQLQSQRTRASKYLAKYKREKRARQSIELLFKEL